MNAQQLTTTARFILNAEARSDEDGNLTVYPLPKGDGGGTFEVAGINDRYDFEVAHRLKKLIESKKYDQAELTALDYYIKNTNGVTLWGITHPAIEAWLRDCIFNRGNTGAAKTYQMALGVPIDGRVGPRTQSAGLEAQKNPSELLRRLTFAAEEYERKVAPPVGPRAKFWKGLQSRWAKRETFARSFL